MGSLQFGRKPPPPPSPFLFFLTRTWAAPECPWQAGHAHAHARTPSLGTRTLSSNPLTLARSFAHSLTLSRSLARSLCSSSRSRSLSRVPCCVCAGVYAILLRVRLRLAVRATFATALLLALAGDAVVGFSAGSHSFASCPPRRRRSIAAPAAPAPSCAPRRYLLQRCEPLLPTTACAHARGTERIRGSGRRWQAAGEPAGAAAAPRRCRCVLCPAALPRRLRLGCMRPD